MSAASPAPSDLALPPEVAAVFREFRTCEFSTLARDGTPITWPTLAFWEPAPGRFLLSTSIALAQKAFNIRRNPRVALLFSNPTASGLARPPAVLVQGDATAPDEVLTSVRGFEDKLQLVFERQPASGMYSSNRVMRWLFDWYYMRLGIVITPRRIRWWPEGDFLAAPREVEVPGVG
ncbi:MAG TPA: pyridoxamine 5'-phosphate oxidase family protein [Chloroflexota bacterium]|nr:pyridoxamine 5'-phosphate oxidase family protein [Chloroflexota bacterium]